jgi:hypothetical protein
VRCGQPFPACANSPGVTTLQPRQAAPCVRGRTGAAVNGRVAYFDLVTRTNTILDNSGLNDAGVNDNVERLAFSGDGLREQRRRALELRRGRSAGGRDLHAPTAPTVGAGATTTFTMTVSVGAGAAAVSCYARCPPPRAPAASPQ